MRARSALQPVLQLYFVLHSAGVMKGSLLSYPRVGTVHNRRASFLIVTAELTLDLGKQSSTLIGGVCVEWPLCGSSLL